MRIGVNITAPNNFPVAMELVQRGEAQFCELLIDNFLHLPPEVIQASLGDVPVSFHIMNSRLMERDEAGLRHLAARLRPFVQVLKPLYVSDHLATYLHQGRRLPVLMEIDYALQFEAAAERLERWQAMLNEKVFLENFPSIFPPTSDQAGFYHALMGATGCGVLFDVCNAVVAHLNTQAEPMDWLSVAKQTDHFHIAGYRMLEAEPPIAMDTHDEPVGEAAIALLEAVRRACGTDAAMTVVVERDANIEVELWSRDIQAVRHAHV